jgi:sugar phosphate isomerase/epimerase
MNRHPNFNRRNFLKSSLLGTAALSALTLPIATSAALTKTSRDPFHGLKMGIASYSVRKFSLDQAIETTRQLGLKYICLKDMHLPYKSTPAERQAARKKIEDAGLVLMGGGVIYMNNKEDEIRSMFEYAKDAGMPTIVASPDPAALDIVEKMAKEFNIRVAIHNHGPGDKRYPSPMDVFRMVKDRDARLGICMDVGHTVRIGEDPIEVMKACASRLYDYHLKDVNEATAKGGSAEVGKGVIDIVAVLKTLLDLKFQDHVALEYEANADAPMPGLIESYAFMRGVLATLA